MRGLKTVDITLDVSLPQVQQHLLTGLEQWLHLGLISDAQARRIGEILAERLPLPTAAPTVFVPSPIPAPAPAPPSAMVRATRAFVAEMSVVWLLFLGVFLVVVSSAVLAASQWSLFPPLGQYGILLVYTLGFWGASRWTRQQGRLQTTTRMLAVATLLLFPINMWVVDGLGLLLATPALLGLSYIVWQLIDGAALRVPFLLLGWLHLGWGWTDSGPLLATYLGTVGTTAWLAYRHRVADRNPPTDNSTDTASRTVVMLSLLILLGRGLLVAQVPVQQLGLALGLCGALLVWLTDNRLWIAVGQILVLFGWAITVQQTPPLQALGVSGLALALLWQRLQKHWRRRDLLLLIGAGTQAYGLLWFVLPGTVRRAILQALSTLTNEPVTVTTWAGVALLPTVGAVLLLARHLKGRQQPLLAKLAAITALLIGLGLTLLSLGNPLMLAANLTGSAGLMLWQLRSQSRLNHATHSLILSALAAWIYALFPDLSGAQWGQVGLVTLTVEWGLSLALQQIRWRRSSWYGGVAIAVLSYTALLAESLLNPESVLLGSWLWVPVALTIVANHPRALKPQQAAGLTMLSLVMGTPFLTEVAMGIKLAADVPASFVLGMLCMALNSRRYPRELTTLFTVGSGLMALASSWFWLTHAESSTLLMVGAVEIVSLWAMQQWLGRQGSLLAELYNRAMQGWSITLLVALYGSLGLMALALYVTPFGVDQAAVHHSLWATGICLVGLAVSVQQRSTNPRWWGLATGITLMAALAMVSLTALADSSLTYLTVALLGLGLVTQLAGDGWTRWRQRPYLSSWHGIPVTYALCGWGLHYLAGLTGHHDIWPSTADSGLYTWAAALVLLGVGRRRLEWQAVSYLGLAGLSLGAYELLIYQMLQTSGGQPGDGLTLLAALAVAIAGCDRILSRALLPYLRISPGGLQVVAHLHWLVGTVLALLAVVSGLSPTGTGLWVAVSLLLAVYALAMGNQRWTEQSTWLSPEGWTWLGWVEALLVIAYARFEIFPQFTVLLNWGGLIACLLGYGLYRLPWLRWGWPPRPAQWIGLGLPLLTLAVTLTQMKTQNLLLVGAFYTWAAHRLEHIRLSYLSVLLFDWAVLRFLISQDWLTWLWLGTVAGLSVLYLAEVEPQLRPRTQRHALRMLGSGLIAATALYQTELSQPLLAFAGLALLVSLVLTIAGTVLQVRAFLYVGVGLFVTQTLRVLWQLVSTDALLLWAIGIVLGLSLIWIAATFESRRTQVSDLLSQWSDRLDHWA